MLNSLNFTKIAWQLPQYQSAAPSAVVDGVGHIASWAQSVHIVLFLQVEVFSLELESN